jgi:hypothetical protein
LHVRVSSRLRLQHQMRASRGVPSVLMVKLLGRACICCSC